MKNVTIYFGLVHGVIIASNKLDLHAKTNTKWWPLLSFLSGVVVHSLFWPKISIKNDSSAADNKNCFINELFPFSNYNQCSFFISAISFLPIWSRHFWTAYFARSKAVSILNFHQSCVDYNQQYSRPRPLPYANTLWPFPSTYSDQQAYLGQPSRPLFYQQPSSYAWPPPQQQHQQPVQLNDLIAELSIALVRSFAQMLADREINGKGGGPFPLGQGSTAQSRDNIFGIPFAQPPQQQQQQQQPSSPFGSRTTTNFGYGVNAGVFAGTYGGSDSIASPYGPYGPINSQIGGGSFSGLSPWPYIPG
jgi:hypothetical protein